MVGGPQLYPDSHTIDFIKLTDFTKFSDLKHIGQSFEKDSILCPKDNIALTWKL